MRNSIIWFKPNGLPSSVKDRLANKYEHVFHFVKSHRYFYDLDAIRVPQKTLEQTLGKGRSRNHCVYDPNDGQSNVALGFKTSGGMVEGARAQRRKGALRLLRSDGKNPGDVFAARQKTADLPKISLMRNPPNPSEPNAFHPLGKNPGDVVRLTKHDIALKKLSRSYFDSLHVNPSHPLGKNPSDLLVLDGQIYPEGQSPAYCYGSRRNKWNPQRKIEEGINSFACWKAARPRTINARGKNPGDICGNEEEQFAFWKATVLDQYARLGRGGQKGFSGKHELLEEGSASFRIALNSGQARNSVYKIIEKLAVSAELKQRLKNWWHDHSGHWLGSNPGDFWKITTKPFPEAHFAVYPEDLCTRPILSSCPDSVCTSCGNPPTPVSQKRPYRHTGNWGSRSKARGMPVENVVAHVAGGHTGFSASRSGMQPASWKTCACGAGFEPGIVFDPFAGAGTTLVVAKKMGRQWLGCELNQKYVDMAKRRLASVASMPV